jgi:hypothetical protein
MCELAFAVLTLLTDFHCLVWWALWITQDTPFNYGRRESVKFISRCNTCVGVEFTLRGKVEDDFGVNIDNWSVMCRFLYKLCLL